MSGKPFADHHSSLFLDAVFDSDVVDLTRWLNAALARDTRIAYSLRRNPFNASAYTVMTYMHESAVLVPSLRWDEFGPDLDSWQLAFMLWSLTDFEVTLLGLDRHINGRATIAVNMDAREADVARLQQLAAAIRWVTTHYGGPATTTSVGT